LLLEGLNQLAPRLQDGILEDPCVGRFCSFPWLPQPAGSFRQVT